MGSRGALRCAASLMTTSSGGSPNGCCCATAYRRARTLKRGGPCLALLHAAMCAPRATVSMRVTRGLVGVPMEITEAVIRRRKQLAAIHVLAIQLGLDDALYRELIYRVSGAHGHAVRSAADLSGIQRNAVLTELRHLAGESQYRARQIVPPAKDAPRSVREEAVAMIGKIGAMLADANRGWGYAHGMARRMFHVTRIEWCTSEQLRRIIAALNYDQRRRRKASP